MRRRRFHESSLSVFTELGVTMADQCKTKWVAALRATAASRVWCISEEQRVRHGDAAPYLHHRPRFRKWRDARRGVWGLAGRDGARPSSADISVLGESTEPAALMIAEGKKRESPGEIRCWLRHGGDGSHFVEAVA